MADPVDAERFVRQMLLPEIGPAGQSLIERGTAAVAGEGLASEVAVRYARTAGFGSVRAGAVDLDILAPSSVCAFDAARAVVAGARAALGEIRAALGRDRYAPRTDAPADAASEVPPPPLPETGA